MPVIQTTDLTKTFGSTRAVDGISLRADAGRIHGLLGLNGAGKTTLIRMLLGMVRPDAGSIELFGQALTPGFDRWNEVGYLVETPHAYPRMTVRENLEVFRLLRGIRSPDNLRQVMDRLGLDRVADTPAGVLSLGNQQRLGLAKALFHRPRLLLLDEPANGLDPEGIVDIRHLLRELADQGTTILVSSHILGEVARTADRLIIVHEGRLITELTAGELDSKRRTTLEIHVRDTGRARSVLAEAGLAPDLTGDSTLVIREASAFRDPEPVIDLLVAHGCTPAEVIRKTEDLEAFFLRTIHDPQT